MTPEQRAAVLDAARYLQQIRPIDPAELVDYVKGQPHPAAIGQVLREAAVELSLVEREDGTFVPVGDEPAVPLTGVVERFPARYGQILEDELTDRFGPHWHRGDSGNRLREVVRRLKEDYYRGRDVSYDADAAFGYAIYHLPDYYAAVQYVLSELARVDLLGRSLRVLDIGAGVGGPALGLCDLLPDDALLEYQAIEPSPAADLLAPLFDAAGRNVHPTIHRETAESFEPEGGYDLLLFANVFSELDDPVTVATRYAEYLTEDGSMVALAPADRETAIGLRAVERALVDDGAADLSVFSPTVRLWPGEAPADRCWSFAKRPDLENPPFQRRLDEPAGATGEFVNVDVQYAYAILRRDGRTCITSRPDGGRSMKFAESEAHVTNRVDCTAIKLSPDLGEGNPLYLIGDGSQRSDHFAVLTHETSLNRSLAMADYGDALSFEGALLLWNADEGAYNLVIDDETIVDRVQ